jgi:tyrosyl-tRNA synthetase
MSKSLRNAVAMEDSPGEMFGRLMSVPDQLIESYATLLTDLDPSVLKMMHPRDAKIEMAKSVVDQFHGTEQAVQSAESFIRVFSRKEIPADVPLIRIARTGSVKLSSVMVQVGAAKSESQAKQLIRQGAVDWNGETVLDPFLQVLPDNHLLKVGKRFYCRVLQGETGV